MRVADTPRYDKITTHAGSSPAPCTIKNRVMELQRWLQRLEVLEARRHKLYVIIGDSEYPKFKRCLRLIIQTTRKIRLIEKLLTTK